MKTHRWNRSAILLVGFILVAATGAGWLALPSLWRPSPARALDQAWDQFRRAGGYEFSTTVEQTTFPAPRASNAGRPSSQEIYHLSGKNDLHNRSLLMTIWQGEGSLLEPGDGIQLKIEGDQAYGRVAQTDWTPIDQTAANSYAMDNDGSVFLQAANNVVQKPADTVSLPQGEAHLAHYTFEVDADRFAGAMRAQMVAALQRSGKLPPNMNLSVSDQYRGMEASGDVWLDGDGLPRRITVRMRMPADRSGERVEATFTTDYLYAPRQNRLASGGFPAALAGLLPSGGLDLDQAALALALGGIFAAFLLVVLVFSQKRWVYATVAVLVIASMLFSPLWEADKSAAFARDMRDQAETSAQEKQAEADRQAEAESLVRSDWNPQVDPAVSLARSEDVPSAPKAGLFAPQAFNLFPDLNSSPQAAGDDENAADSDHDGLTDEYEQSFNDITILDPNAADTDSDGIPDGQEVRLGLTPGQADSDGDTIDDIDEISSFYYNGLNWYINPAERDTDRDGQLDGAECLQRAASAAGHATAVCQDTDGDGSPDVFDTDDDGDGVPTSIDESPFNYSAVPAAYTAESPFKFSVSGLGDGPDELDPSLLDADAPVFITYQLRPQNAKHLTYAMNVLEWPTPDTDGQVMRISDDTFATAPAAMSEDHLAKDPRAANGDLRLVPMLEVRLTGASLPLPLNRQVNIEDARDAHFDGSFILTSDAAQPGKTTLHLTTTTGPVYVFYAGGSCDAPDNSVQIGGPGQMVSGGTAVIDTPLATAANGTHLIYTKAQLSGTAPYSCFPIPATPHGPDLDQVVDSTRLGLYGAAARLDTDGSVLLYAPLALLTEFEGAVPSAFAARLPFSAANGGFDSSTQEVRVVWVLNMLTDQCLPIEAGYDEAASGDWCSASSLSHWIKNVPQVVQSYPESFQVTGLTVKQDLGAEMAVVFEDPLTDLEPNYDDPLWALANGMESTFLAARSTGDIRDLTVDEIAHRFDKENNADIPSTLGGNPNPAFWGLSRDAFQAVKYSYAASEDVGQFPTGEVQDLFAEYFSAGRLGSTPIPSHANLLFTREANQRSVSMGDPAAVTCAAGLCSLDFSGQSVITTAVMNWAPYRRNPEAWESFPLTDYLDLLEANLRQADAFRPEGYDASQQDFIDELDGMIAVARLYYQELNQGIAVLVAVNGKPVVDIPAVLDDFSVFNGFNSLNSKAQIATKVIKALAEMFVDGLLAKGRLWTLFHLVGGSITTKIKGFFQAIGQGFMQKLSALGNKLSTTLLKVLFGIAIGVVIAGLIACAVIYLINMGKSNLAGKWTGRLLFAAVGLVSLGLAVMSLKSLYTIYSTTKTITTAAKTAAVVGAVIGVVIAWGVFFTAWGLSGASAGSLVVNNLAAEAIAQTVMIVLMAVLSATVVGAIIVAVIALIDAIIMTICALAGFNERDEGDPLREYFCIGISGWVTKIIKWLIYSQNYLIKYDDGSRLSFTGLSQTLTDEAKGMSVGNSMKLQIDLENTLTKAPFPIDWKAAFFFWQWSDSYAKSATFDYRATAQDTDIDGSLERYTDVNNGRWQAIPGASSQWKGAYTTPESEPIALPAAGLNRDPTVIVNEGSAVPVQECIGIPVFFPFFFLIPACWLRTERNTIHMPIGSSVSQDVFPATLDGFYTLAQSGNLDGGYTLGWGRDAALTFGVQRDADGDSLVSGAFAGGNDPDDSQFDTDADGVGDAFEVAQGMNPRLNDTDDDGLKDADELRQGTDPLRKDSDGDGLTDGEELAGWMYTYGFASDNSPLETMVYPDPLTADTDYDGITDFRERLYGFNPNVPEEANVLTYDLGMRELDAPLILLQFDEAPGAAAFADSSHFGFDAACSETSCPVSGGDGRYGSAVRFDGASQYVTLPTTAGPVSFAGQPFTLAGWVYNSGGGTLLAKWSTAAGQKQELTFTIDANGTLTLANGAGGSISSSTHAAGGRWAHVAVSYDGASTAAFYIDGNAAGSGAWTSTANSGTIETPICVGASLTGTGAANTFNGKLDEIAVFDRALSAGEIRDRLVTARYNLNDEFVRPTEQIAYTSTVTNLLESRFAYGLLTTLIDRAEAIVEAALHLLPKTFTLNPKNPGDPTGNTDHLTDTITIASDAESGPLNITQAAEVQIVDRRSESNRAELWLEFNEASGSDFTDSSGSLPPRDVHCASNCPTSGAAGILNNAISLPSGGGQSLALPSLETMKVAGPASAAEKHGYTLSMWVKPGASAGDSEITLLQSQDHVFDLKLVSTGLAYTPALTVNGTPVALSFTRLITNNLWVHLVVRYDDTLPAPARFEVFIDGVKAASSTSVSYLTLADGAHGTLTLGGVTQPASLSIDDLRIFARPLSIMDVNRLAENPVLKLDMEGSGAFTDSSAYGQPVSYAPNGWPGRAGGSIRGASLNPGSGSGLNYLKVTGNPAVDLTDGSFSISAWIRPTSSDPNVWQGVFGYNSGDADAYPTLERMHRRLRFGFGDGSTWVASPESGDVLQLDAWNYVTITFQPAGAVGSYDYRLYINAIPVQTYTFTTHPASATTFFVGHSSYKYKSLAPSFLITGIGGDPGSYAEPWIYRYGGPSDPTKLWDGDVTDTNTYSLNGNTGWIYNYATVSYDIWEDDTTGDDHCGTYYQYWYEEPHSESDLLYDGVNGYLYLELQRPSIEFRGQIDELQIYRYPIDSVQAYDMFHSIPVTAAMPLDDRPTSQTFENRSYIGALRDGNCSGDACPAAGMVGLINQAARFDGQNDVIVAPVDTTSNYMVSLWVNTTCEDCGVYSLRGAKSGSTPGAILSQVYMKNGNGCAKTGDSGTELCSTSGSLADGQWHHLVYINTGSSLTLYLDGAVENSLSVSNPLANNPTGEAWLGYAGEGAQDYLNGELDDVRVFRYTQAADVIAALKRRAPVLLSHLDEPTGASSFADATPADWTFSCATDPDHPASDTCPKAGTQGRLGNAPEFDGQNDVLSLDQSTLSTATYNFSVSLWVKPTRMVSSGEAQTLWALDRPGANATTYGLAIAAGGMKLCVIHQSDTGACAAESKAELVLNSWNLVVLTVERIAAVLGGNATERYSLYINGYLDTTVDLTQTPPYVWTSLGKLTLGNQPAGAPQDGGAFAGQIDEAIFTEYLLNEIDVRNQFIYQMSQEEAHKTLSMVIDAGVPSVALADYDASFHYLTQAGRLLQVTASDDLSGVAMVEMEILHEGASTGWITAPVCLDSVNNSAFCPMFMPAAAHNGPYVVHFRATDRVGNQATSPDYAYTVDDRAPSAYVEQEDSLLAARLHPAQRHTWTLSLSGQVTDPVLDHASPGAGVDPDSIKITVESQAGVVVGDGTQLPELKPIINGYAWSIAYVIPEVEPTGKLTVRLSARDFAGNVVEHTGEVFLDASHAHGKLQTGDLPGAPASLTAADTSLSASVYTGGPFTGSVDDQPSSLSPYFTVDATGAISGVQQVQTAFTPSIDTSYLFNEPYPEGLLAWLPLDEDKVPQDADGNPDPEASGRLFIDISPYQVAGTCAEPDCPTAGVSGHRSGSIYFDGDHKSIDLGQQVDLSGRSFTLSIWARRDAAGRNDPVVWQGPASITHQRLLFGLGADNRFVCGFGGSDLVTPEAYADTGWHYWACSFDKATGKRTIYRDGQPVAADTAAPLAAMNEPLFIGLAPFGSFKGYLDELVILDHALSAAGIRDQYTGANPVFRLDIEEDFYASGDHLPDRSGYFHTALLDSGGDDPENKVTGGAVGDYALSLGYFEKQLKADDSLTVGPAYSLQLDRGAFTETAWVYVDPAGGAGHIISALDQNPERRYPSLSFTADFKLSAGFGDGYDFRSLTTTQPALTPGEWNFVAATFDGTTYRLFANGHPVAQSEAYAGIQPYPADVFRIGEGLAGGLDDIRIYPRALSELEIAALAATGWREATLDPGASSWNAEGAGGIEGPYQLGVRAWDKQGHYSTGDVLNQWNGMVDTLAPRLSVSRTPIDPADPYIVAITFTVEDTLLDEASIHQNLCPETTVQRAYYNSSWYLATGIPPNSALYRLTATCTSDTRLPFDTGIYACDVGGNCSAQVLTSAYPNHTFLPMISNPGGSQPPASNYDPAEAIREEALTWPVLTAAFAPDSGAPAPGVEISTTELTAADFRTVMTAALKGRVVAPAGVAALSIRILKDGNEIYSGSGAVYGELWNAAWVFAAGHPPADGVYRLEVTVIDQTGKAATASRDITVRLAR